MQSHHALRRIIRLSALIIGIPVLLGAAFAGYVYHDSNFHEVLADELYRSAQMSDKDLAARIEAHGIRSVLNLRGEHPEAGWYQDEIKVSDAAGVRHYSLALSARTELTPKQQAELLQIMNDAPKPLLVHCLQGADRSGLAAALYLRHTKKLPIEQASEQLSLWYGHFPWLGSRTSAMDRSLQRAEASSANP